MRVVVAGSSGLIGTALVGALEAEDHQVIRLVRRSPQAPSESSWDPVAGMVDRKLISSADLVVNLAGASIGDHRLTRRYAKVVLDSRIQTTRLLAKTLAIAGHGRLIQASAMGYYGIRGDEPLPERSAPGSGLLAGITARWEDAARPASDAGVQVSWLRTGLVLAPNGGLVKRLFPLLRVGALRRLGPGDNWLSWITLDDAVRAITFLVPTHHNGPANLVAPEPTRSRDLIEALGAATGRRGVFPVPAGALRLAVGPAASDLLGSQVGVPGVLTRLGFTWLHPNIEDAAAWAISEARGKPD